MTKLRVLLVVDVQNDFCPDGALEVPSGNEVVPVCNALMESGEYDVLVASKDWHPSNHVSFASNHAGHEVHDNVVINGKEQHLWPNHCVQTSTGAEFHPDLKSDLFQYVVHKGSDPEIDSYSAFFDNDERTETGLSAYLEGIGHGLGLQNGDVEITVAGLATDYCVAATALHAVKLGYQTALIYDACRAVNVSPGDEERTLRELAGQGVKILESREILAPVEKSRDILSVNPGVAIAQGLSM